MSRCHRACFFALTVLLLIPVARATDSPQFRGPDRDGVYPAAGLLKSWPEGGPKKLWSAAGIGEGFASVSVADGRIYATGEKSGTGYVSAHDLEGKPLWSRSYGEIHNGGGYPGTRTTPTFDGGRLYLLSSKGKAAAFDAASGEKVWEMDLAAAYDARNIRWGITESPLVLGDKVIFTPGGSDATMVALAKKTGDKVWLAAGVGDKSGYCSPRLLEHGELRQIVTLTAGHLIGVDADSGDLMWKREYPASYGIHAGSPLFEGRTIFVSDGYDQGTKAFELAADGKSVTSKWETRELDVHHGGIVLADGRLYGAASNGTWYALDAATGEVRASIRRLGKGSVVMADGRLYGYTEAGKVFLVDPDPAHFEVVGELRITEGEGQHWAHPVIAGGVLYVRHGDVLMAFDVAGDGSGEG